MDRICLGLLMLLANVALGQTVIMPTATEAKIAALEARITALEQENAELRAKLLARDAGKQPTPAETAKIIMQSIPGCLACEQWYSLEGPKFVASGWVVEREDSPGGTFGLVFPRWRVCLRARCIEIDNCSNTRFMERVREFVNGTR